MTNENSKQTDGKSIRASKFKPTFKLYTCFISVKCHEQARCQHPNGCQKFYLLIKASGQHELTDVAYQLHVI